MGFWEEPTQLDKNQIQNEINSIEKYIEEIKSDPNYFNTSTFNIIEYKINSLNDNNADIPYSLTEEIWTQKAKVLKNSINKYIKMVKSDDNYWNFIDDIVSDINKLSELGPDVSEYKKEIIPLIKNLLEKNIKRINSNPDYADTSDLNYIKSYLIKLENYGEDTSEYDNKFPKLKQKVLINNIEHNISELIDYPEWITRGDIDSLEDKINELKRLNIDVSKYEKEIPNLRIEKAKQDIIKKIKKISSNPEDYSEIDILYLNNDIKELKIHWIDTSEFEKKLPILIKKLEENNPDNLLHDELKRF